MLVHFPVLLDGEHKGFFAEAKKSLSSRPEIRDFIPAKFEITSHTKSGAGGYLTGRTKPNGQADHTISLTYPSIDELEAIFDVEYEIDGAMEWLALRKPYRVAYRGLNAVVQFDKSPERKWFDFRTSTPKIYFMGLDPFNLLCP